MNPDSQESLEKNNSLVNSEESTKFFSADQSLLSSTKFDNANSTLIVDTDSNDTENHREDPLANAVLFSPIVKPTNSAANLCQIDENQNPEESELVSNHDQNNRNETMLMDEQKSQIDENDETTLMNFSQDFSSIVIDMTDPDGHFDPENLPHTVKVLHYTPKNQTIYLVGTSHFSKESHKDVRQVIKTFKPQTVMLELCRNRLAFLTLREEEIIHDAKNLDFGRILDYMRKNGVVQGMIYMFLLTASSRVTVDLDMAPGGEFRNAYNEAKLLPNCRIVLGDRPIDITLKRLIASLSIWQRFQIAYACLWSNQKFDEQELEQYKKEDVLELIISDLGRLYPGLAKVMVEERDQYLTSSLYKACVSSADSANIVAVVGIGHSAGIERCWPQACAYNLMSEELGRAPEYKPMVSGRMIKLTAYSMFGVVVYRYILPKSAKILLKNVGFAAVQNITKFFTTAS